MSLHDQLHHPGKRMATEDRRESILAAATAVFGERGYVGATTDQIAKQAGISQAYVVRMFGSKEELFVEVGRRATDRVAAAFRDAIATFGADTGVEERAGRLAGAYSNLIADRGTLLTLMHFMMLGADDRLGPMARETYLSIYRTIRDDAGMGRERARDFLARGMLINTIMALRLPDMAPDDEDAYDLIDAAFEGKGDECIALSGLQPKLEGSQRA